MENLTVTINSHTYSGECKLSDTLEQFLHCHGADSVPELLVGENGKQVAPSYALALLHRGATLKSVPSEEPIASLTMQDILAPVCE